MTSKYAKLMAIALAGLFALMHSAAYAGDNDGAILCCNVGSKPISVEVQAENGLSSLGRKTVGTGACVIYLAPRYNYYKITANNSTGTTHTWTRFLVRSRTIACDEKTCLG